MLPWALMHSMLQDVYGGSAKVGKDDYACSRKVKKGPDPGRIATIMAYSPQLPLRQRLRACDMSGDWIPCAVPNMAVNLLLRYTLQPSHLHPFTDQTG